MKKTIKIICVTAACIFLGLIAYIGFAGRKEKNAEQQYSFYYINSEETKLKEEKYTPEKETAEVMLRDFSESLNNCETREDGISLFPEGVKISSYSIKDGILRLEFNEAYSKMSRTRELLVRTGVVKIFIQIPGIDSVEIYVGKKPLTNSKGEEVGAMNSDTFVEFSGSDGKGKRNQLMERRYLLWVTWKIMKNGWQILILMRILKRNWSRSEGMKTRSRNVFMRILNLVQRDFAGLSEPVPTV